MPHVLTLTGSSGSGKSTAFEIFLKVQALGYQPHFIPKYTTRKARPDDAGEAISVPFIPPECDLVYEQYGDRYGFAFESIFSALQAGKTPIIIVNDVRVVEDIRNVLGEIVRSIFVFRSAPTLEQYQNLSQTRGAMDEQTIKKRFNKAQAVHRIYIENIHLFDHVILNSGGMAELERQVSHVIEELSVLSNSRLLKKGKA